MCSISCSTSEILSQKLPMETISQLETWSQEELIEQISLLQTQAEALTHTLEMSKAEAQAAGSHCTIIQCELTDTKTKLANANKKRNRGLTKIKARFVTGPDLKDQFDKDEKEAEEKARQLVEKEKEDAARSAEHDRQITEATISKVFENSLSSYKLKDDLIILAHALQISDQGKNSDLSA